jgi:hypothetical protein
MPSVENTKKKRWSVMIHFCASGTHTTALASL